MCILQVEILCFSSSIWQISPRSRDFGGSHRVSGSLIKIHLRIIKMSNLAKILLRFRRPRWKVLLFFFIWIMEWRKPSNPLTHSSSKMMETFLHLIMSHKPTTWANNNYILESNQPSVRRPYNHEFMHSHTGVTIFIISVRQFQLVSRFLFSRHILMSKKLRVFGARFWSYTRTILLKKRSCCVIANLSDISPYASFDCVHVTHNFYLFLSFV